MAQFKETVSSIKSGDHVFVHTAGATPRQLVRWIFRGASLSPGSKPIIALTSTTRRNESKISSFLKPGAGVVTTRAHLQYIVTEYGVANLYGKKLR